MFGALAAAEQTAQSTVALVHSAPGALMPPGGAFEMRLLPAVNALRAPAGIAPVASLWESWARFPAFSNSIPRLDPLAGQAPETFAYFGPFSEQVAPSSW